MSKPLLESVPNLSVGRDEAVIGVLARAFDDASIAGASIDGSSAEIVDLHRDEDHDRTVLSIVGRGEALAQGLERLARACVIHLDVNDGDGVHPRMGVLDVLPVIALGRSDEARAAAHALVERLARVLGEELGVPAVRYGRSIDDVRLAGAQHTGAVRRGGIQAVLERMASGELERISGPAFPHPTAGLTLCGVRDVLIAFNVDLASRDVDEARTIAAAIREAGGGSEALFGVRSIGLLLERRGVAQVSCNIEQHDRCGPARVLESVVRLAKARGIAVDAAELVGLAPDSALAPLRYACSRHGAVLRAAAAPSLEQAVGRAGSA